MQTVTIIKHAGHPIEIPINNLDNTLRILGDQVKKVDYGVTKVASSTDVKIPDMTWNKKKLLKHARENSVEVQDNDTKSMILKAINA